MNFGEVVVFLCELWPSVKALLQECLALWRSLLNSLNECQDGVRSEEPLSDSSLISNVIQARISCLNFALV